jgi:hypothetical protein
MLKLSPCRLSNRPLPPFCKLQASKLQAAARSHPFLDKRSDELILQEIPEVVALDHAACVPSAHLEWIAELRLVCRQGKLRTRVERQSLIHQRLFVYSENQQGRCYVPTGARAAQEDRKGVQRARGSGNLISGEESRDELALVE